MSRVARHIPEIEYEEIERYLSDGKLVAIAPAINADGKPNIVMLTTKLSPYQKASIVRSTPDERALLALRFIRQVREHFEIDKPKGES